MPSFMIFALWVGANFLPGAPRETGIIPENPNQSKGLLPNLVLCQAFERTGFFLVPGVNRPDSCSGVPHFVRPPSLRSPASSGGLPLARSPFLHGIEELVVVLRGAQLVQEEFGRLELV